MLITIVNPAAGGGRCGKRVESALERLRHAGLVLDVHYTERAGHASEIAREAYERGARGFLAVGGDGTSFEIINGIFPRPEEDDDSVVLGILPLGTGNSFLRDFQITDAEGALRALERGKTRPVDVVRAEHAAGTIHYINLLSIGFTAEAGEMTNEKFKSLGAAGYVLAVLSCTVTLSHPVFPVRLDGGDLDDRPCVLLSFSNSRFTGGTMMMAPHADPADGVVDVIRVGPVGKLKLVRTFPRIFTGGHVKDSEVEETTASEIVLEDVGPTPVMVDGEVLELSLRKLQVLPSALEVIA